MTLASCVRAALNRSNAIILRLFGLSIITYAISYSQSVSISDFRIPTSEYQRLTGSLNARWNRNSWEYGTDTKSTDMNNNANGDGDLSYVLAKYSEERSLELNASFDPSFSWYSSSDDAPSVPYHSTSRNYTVTARPALYVRYSPYIQPDTWFWTGQAQAWSSVGYTHSISHWTNTQTDTSWSNFAREQDYQYTVGLGIGYGKVRDGRSVFAALRVQDKLQEDSVLSRPLTREEVLSVSDILARQNEYAYSQDRYYKFIMEEVFKTLESMGVIKGSVASAFAVMRAFEVIQYETIEPRVFGWRISASIVRSASQFKYVTTDYGSFTRSAMEFLQLQSDYGYPLTLSTHLTAGGTVSIPRRDVKRRIGFSVNAGLTHQMTDRVDARLAYHFSRAATFAKGDEDEAFNRDFVHSVSATLIFFIENDITFNVTGGYSHQNTNSFNSGSSQYATGNSFASFGVRYRFF